MRILGIDPGYALMGYGVIERNGSRLKVIDYGSISTGPSAPMPERLKFLYSSLMDIIAETQPETASFEELFYNTNAKTVINVGQARGVAVLACVNSGLEIAEYTPLQIKQALVGYGRAEKKQVQQMVKAILGLEKVPKPDDTADALAAAICHANSIRGSASLQSAIDRALAKEASKKKKTKKQDDFRIIR
ncbi:MAG: crossover junction endodeoxyribonuclease RuvC [Anaerovoracaceae bacterium]|nr:crossover junction endodeoxyribonuclease RuvC [Bacillota bacterium]MDY2671421.1 crossover junction endodeoxyribonuclease RuvC [Anaerovoracaceae bacterium]